VAGNGTRKPQVTDLKDGTKQARFNAEKSIR
jgi:hypothetical protein